MFFFLFNLFPSSLSFLFLLFPEQYRLIKLLLHLFSSSSHFRLQWSLWFRLNFLSLSLSELNYRPVPAFYFLPFSKLSNSSAGFIFTFTFSEVYQDLPILFLHHVFPFKHKFFSMYFSSMSSFPSSPVYLISFPFDARYFSLPSSSSPSSFQLFVIMPHTLSIIFLVFFVTVFFFVTSSLSIFPPPSILTTLFFRSFFSSSSFPPFFYHSSRPDYFHPCIRHCVLILFIFSLSSFQRLQFSLLFPPFILFFIHFPFLVFFFSFFLIRNTLAIFSTYSSSVCSFSSSPVYLLFFTFDFRYFSLHLFSSSSSFPFFL